MPRRSVVAVLTVLLWSACIGSALSDDLFPPPWRGLSGTTFAQWFFGDPSTTPPADRECNPNGPAEMLIYPSPGCCWQECWGGRYGIWPLSGIIKITIPNFPPPNPYKDVWVQITWAATGPGGRPCVTAEVPNLCTLESKLIDERVIEDGTGTPLPVVWYHSTYAFHIVPNPPLEIIWIQGAVCVDQVVVDTRCVPEPGGIVAFATGLIGFVGFVGKWRRRG